MSRSDISQVYAPAIEEVAAEGKLSLPDAHVEVAIIRKSNRISALDFTKGSLVLIMVLYHWMNYFVMADGSIYKYLRFLTPSFIFITGFLISQVYLSKYQASRSHAPGRLLLRGFKLLAIVLCLNLALSTVHLNGLRTRMADWSLADTLAAYFTGMAPVAFSVLVPIAYLLILSAGLLPLSQRYKNIFHLACAVFIGGALLFELKEIRAGYLQVFSIGMLGISIGYIPIDRINSLFKHPMTLLIGYLAYLSAITLWDDVYPLQVVGVCLSLAVIYGVGLTNAESNQIARVVVLLGHYSLFAYIAQIVILQLIRRSLLPLGNSIGVAAAALLTGAALTILSVTILDRARPRIAGLNRVYIVVFN
jgi:peptidoglycan/LPS O-acetylase OafA/YrhL